MARKPTDEIQLKLRFDERLRRRIEREAERNGRSMNAEIIGRLDKSFEEAPLDLYKLLASEIEAAQNQAKPDATPDEKLFAFGRILVRALEQLLTDLHSVKLTFFEADGENARHTLTSYSEKATAKMRGGMK